MSILLTERYKSSSDISQRSWRLGGSTFCFEYSGLSLCPKPEDLRKIRGAQHKESTHD
jgi:hypothetical protein